jgi:outer membrane protein OmpA-like peptidoglycan-associated protein
MEEGYLVVKIMPKKGTKEKELITTDKIADGTIITPYLVNKDYKVIMEKDQFTRVTEQSFTAQFNYERGKSVVRPTELKDKDIVAFSKWLGAAQTNPKIAIKSINITGYASPEGEENKNNTLSTDRAEAAKQAALGLAKAAKNASVETISFNLNGRGEDYEGFKKELQGSAMNEDEKNLVIRVLEMHSDPVTRETEMRNMGKTFKYLDDNIFPKLRRAEISIVYDLTGYTDEELKTISTTMPDSLKVEELLFAAIDSTRVGGIVAYVTCSPYIEETWAVVDSVVQSRTDVQREDARGLFPGVSDLGDGPYVQLWPHVHGTDAMFFALLRRV